MAVNKIDIPVRQFYHRIFPYLHNFTMIDNPRDEAIINTWIKSMINPRPGVYHWLNSCVNYGFISSHFPLPIGASLKTNKFPEDNNRSTKRDSLKGLHASCTGSVANKKGTTSGSWSSKKYGDYFPTTPTEAGAWMWNRTLQQYSIYKL